LKKIKAWGGSGDEGELTERQNKDESGSKTMATWRSGRRLR
jgi:hypothetical protein